MEVVGAVQEEGEEWGPPPWWATPFAPIPTLGLQAQSGKKLFSQRLDSLQESRSMQDRLSRTRHVLEALEEVTLLF